MKMPYDNLIHTFLNLFLPRQCAGCGLENEVFCVKCAEASYKAGTQCLICGFRNKDGKICYGCRKFGPQQVLWTGRYEGELKEAIWQLKYKKRKELARPLAELLWKKFCEIELSARVLQDLAQSRHGGTSREIRQQANIRVLQNASTKALVIPIPLHFKKEYERGFNQAELLAREFSKLSNIQCLTNALIKTRETPAQVEVENKELRIRNLEGAFLVNHSTIQPFNYSTIVLIDDVSTTGATLFHAASALEKAGVKKIIGLVLAHGG